MKMSDMNETENMNKLNGTQNCNPTELTDVEKSTNDPFSKLFDELDEQVEMCSSANCQRTSPSQSASQMFRSKLISQDEPKVVIGSNAWHFECLICSGDCKKNLNGQPYCLHNGVPYCEAEYGERFAPKCRVCLQGVTDDGIMIDEAVLRLTNGKLISTSSVSSSGSDTTTSGNEKKPFVIHKKCLTCNICAGTPSIEAQEDCAVLLCEEGEADANGLLPLKLLCAKDYMNVTEHCSRCHESVSPLENFIRIVNRNRQLSSYHPECFTCTTCGDEQDPNGQILLHPNVPGILYCSDDIPAEFRCPQCNDTVFMTDGSDTVNRPTVELEDRYWHRECLKCPYCVEDPISSDESSEENRLVSHDGKVICTRHYTKQFCDKCSRCTQPILTGAVIRIKSNSKSFNFHKECFTCTTCNIVLTDQMSLVNEKFYCHEDAEVIKAQNRAANTVN